MGSQDIPPIDDAQRALLDEAEALTDQLVAPAYDILDEQGRAAMLMGLTGMRAAVA